MKHTIFILCFAVAFCGTQGTQPPTCTLPVALIPKEWRTMVHDCTIKMREQVNTEIEASMTYLAMGSHFLQDNVNRPGFAKFFLDSASEERQHALKLLEYLLMRGELTQDPEFKNSTWTLMGTQKPKATVWDSAEDALKAALQLETSVTKNIRDIIVACEEPENKYNDYHVVDWLTGEFLDEQYKGQRDLAGKISTLSKMMKAHGALGEFLYDKTLL